MQTELRATSFKQPPWLLVLFVIVLIAVVAVAQNTNSNTNGNTNSSGTRTSTTANTNNTNTQAGGTTTSTTTSTTPTTTGCPDLKDVTVTNVFKGNRIGEPKDQAAPLHEPPDVQLGDDLTLEVKNLDTLMQRAQCTTPHKQIVLFLNGRPVKNLTPFPPTDPKGQRLVFPLKRTDDAREVWAFILGSPSLSPRPTDVSVGLDGEYAVDSNQKVNLKVVPTGWFIFWLLLFLALLVGFLVLAKRSDVLRESGDLLPNNVRKAYSLARTQAAWWFFISLASYLGIGIITGDFSTSITGTVLVLLGISAGQVVGSAAVDAGSAANAAAPPAGGAPPAPPAAEPTTGHWWYDIITDKTGVSFHRFQNAVWTLVLGIIFIVQVYKVLAMPQFSETLLGLMGISAGTFLGMKINENK